MAVSQVAIDAVNHYMSKGVARGPAIGIVACLWYESKLNPGSQGVQHTETPGALNPSGAFGIASWNGPRQKALADYAASKNLPAGDLNTQLDFVLTECANSYPRVWSAIQSGVGYQNFIPVFVADYENPANPQAEINGAMAEAGAMAPFIPDTVATAPVAKPTPAPTPKPTPAPTPVTGGFTMDPALIAALAPIVESLVAGLFKALLSQMSQNGLVTPGAAPAAAAPDLGGIANALAPVLTGALTSTLPGLIAAELAKITPAPGTKP